MNRLQELFEGHATVLARALLGCELTVTTARGAVTVRLTEVEAYGDQGEDPGSHAYRGKTLRNATMFGPPRHVYIYRSYGIHFCLNLVSHAAGGGGVLLRAGEVLAGRDLAVERRGGKDTGKKLLSGPGRLGQGLGVLLPMDGTPLQIGDQDSAGSDEALASFCLRPPEESLMSGDAASSSISSGPRVGVYGVGGSSDYPWRFWITGDPTVSQYRPGKGVISAGSSGQ
ncbi:DNA-3-methyladenine glycosylase [Nesterenkonia sp. MY13]|uniref:Putative 3-methyladenine DNA glycosylase n=1 Tax=Nesterenkonia sedimenti TaxID=1463632 RepID=A0A7X8TLZ6_9MICC|nr:DNA-3-methyladenine glycosylase [Nesterenkonia sedimenti]